MVKSIDQLLEENKKLHTENEALTQQLVKINKSIGAAETGNIDALVFKSENEVKVYTEAAADKSYRILFEKMNEGAITLSKAGIILYCNSCFANMVNTALQKVIGSELKEYIVDSSKSSFDKLLKQRKKKNVKLEVTIYSADSKETPVLLSLNALTLNNKSIFNIILTDLTIPNKNLERLKHSKEQLAKKRAELEIANIDLESFNYISNHDLQEPLRKIQNFISLLLKEERPNLSIVGKRYFQNIQATSQRMQMLIDDLLVYSRSKNTAHKLEKTNLNTIVNEVIKDYEIAIKEQRAVITVNNLCELSVIRFQFFQLFHNLFSNALKFAKPQHPPHISIKSKTGKGHTFKNETLASDLNYCRISFSDNGIGFDPQYESRIFEVFQRLNSAADYNGTGIGLSICKRIVDNHKGVITATSKLNKGVRFDIYIPA